MRSGDTPVEPLPLPPKLRRKAGTPPPLQGGESHADVSHQRSACLLLGRSLLRGLRKPDLIYGRAPFGRHHGGTDYCTDKGALACLGPARFLAPASCFPLDIDII